jgi:putative hydrolase of the HAD superfamily
MERCKAIIFDLDDTLYPEREYVMSGFRAAAGQVAAELALSAEGCFEDLRGLFESGIRTRTFDTWLAQRHLPASLAAEMIRAYREHPPAISLHGDVEPFLGECVDRGARLAIVTDGYLGVQQRKIEALNLAARISQIVYSDAFGRDAWKPSPIPYQAALRALDLPAEACIYVGDNPEKDFRGARAAGLRSVRIRRGCGLYDRREPADRSSAPDAEITSFGELGDATIGIMRPERLKLREAGFSFSS